MAWCRIEPQAIIRSNDDPVSQLEYIAVDRPRCVLRSPKSVSAYSSSVICTMVGNYTLKCQRGDMRYWPEIEPHNRMLTSWNGNIFRVTGNLWGELTCHRWIPRTKASDAELWCFLWSALACLNERLNKQSWGWWFEKPSCPLWRHNNGLFGRCAQQTIYHEKFLQYTAKSSKQCAQ